MATRSPARSSRPRSAPAAVSPRPVFHKKGLTYFWVLNDRCDLAQLEPQLQAFAADPNVAAVCLHPRPGLLLPYGGTEWFDFIRALCRRCREVGLDVWLYDEDPYPSGAAGGRIVAEHPEYCAREINFYEHNPRMLGDTTIFGFPTGNLLWCGLVNPETGATVDLTERVGMLRREWRIWERWDSRNFYPQTPLYHFQRADTRESEFAVTVPEIPAGMKLVAFVARHTSYESCWGALQDTLNPDCTKLFLKLTHERYLKSVGDLFGKEIKAIFTDEPKCMSFMPWTGAMFGEFRKKFGYDLRPRLIDLFSNLPNDRACLTRLHYRQYIGQRFEESWLKPVSKWCHDHGLYLVGHISPEDDPVEQSSYLGNLFPLFKHFDLAGIDLIIPAVGDHRHPMISVGVTAAVSNAQQNNLMGVMSESGACAGDNATAEQFGKQLYWQTVMGMTSPVVHCAYSSVRGPRAYEYPPNYGPNSPLWPGMKKVQAELARLQEVTHGARAVAPVAILWTIRSFNMIETDWQKDPTGIRASTLNLLAACLDHQVGTHFIDERVLWDAPLVDGELTIGLARYRHLLIPDCLVLHEKTAKRLEALRAGGFDVAFTGVLPTRQQGEKALRGVDFSDFVRETPQAAAGRLPRVIDLVAADGRGDTRDIRCTAWEKNGKTRRLIINLRETPFAGKVAGKAMKLPPGKAQIL